MDKKKLLFIIGSLREKTFNSTVTKYIEKVVENRIDVKFPKYSKLPHMN